MESGVNRDRQRWRDNTNGLLSNPPLLIPRGVCATLSSVHVSHLSPRRKADGTQTTTALFSIAVVLTI